MPRYDYECPHHGVTEKVHGMNEKVELFCEGTITGGDGSKELCGVPLRRVFIPQNVVYKGTGFYSTDSRKITRHADVM